MRVRRKGNEAMKTRVNLRLSAEAIRKLDELCGAELRDRSNMVEVLILRGQEELLASKENKETETEETPAQQG